MEFAEIYSFLASAASEPDKCWESTKLDRIACAIIPPLFMGRRGILLKADIHILWTQWFLEAICDPENFVDSYKGYAYVLEIVRDRVPLIVTELTKPERDNLTVIISRLIDEEIQRRQERKRKAFSQYTKEMLWDIYGPEPRCWICGYKFSKWAEEKFFGKAVGEPPMRQFIDYIKPNGLKPRHMSVEIDHLLPFSRGGDEDANLRLVCGWCNTHKSNKISLYDVPSKPRMAKHPNLNKIITIPHPFWVVRTLAIKRQCEYEGGCNRTIDSDDLTIAPRHPEGAMNPTNLRVTCIEHDPLGSNRFLSREIVKKLVNHY